MGSPVFSWRTQIGFPKLTAEDFHTPIAQVQSDGLDGLVRSDQQFSRALHSHIAVANADSRLSGKLGNTESR